MTSSGVISKFFNKVSMPPYSNAIRACSTLYCKSHSELKLIDSYIGNPLIKFLKIATFMAIMGEAIYRIIQIPVQYVMSVGLEQLLSKENDLPSLFDNLS